MRDFSSGDMFADDAGRPEKSGVSICDQQAAPHALAAIYKAAKVRIVRQAA